MDVVDIEKLRRRRRQIDKRKGELSRMVLDDPRMYPGKRSEIDRELEALTVEEKDINGKLWTVERRKDWKEVFDDT